MPNLFTHRLLVDKLCQDKVVSGGFLAGEEKALSLGTQGPDPLFYEGLIPWRAWRPGLARARLGNQLHRSDGREFMVALLDEVERDPQNKTLAAFVFGQFCHYLLDRVCHPYVYYMSGFDRNGKLTGPYHYAHSHFESEIDVALALVEGKTPMLEKPWLLLPTDRRTIAAVDPALGRAVGRCFGRKLPATYYLNAVLNMRTMVRTVNVAPEWLLKIFGRSILTGLHLPRRVDRSVLNEEHAVWRHPVTDEPHDESFPDLFSQALALAEQAYDGVVKYGLNWKTLEPYYDGLNYKGTKPGAYMLHHR